MATDASERESERATFLIFKHRLGVECPELRASLQPSSEKRSATVSISKREPAFGRTLRIPLPAHDELDSVIVDIFTTFW